MQQITEPPPNKKQTLTELKGKIDSLTIIVGDFSTQLSLMNRTIRQINKEIEDLNNIKNQLDLTEIYRTLHPTTAECISSQVHMEHYPG